LERKSTRGPRESSDEDEDETSNVKYVLNDDIIQTVESEHDSSASGNEEPESSQENWVGKTE